MKYKKSYSHIREKSLDHSVAFIVKLQDTYPIKIMCKVLKLQRSTYYKKLYHKASNREIENKKLDEAIKEIY